MEPVACKERKHACSAPCLGACAARLGVASPEGDSQSVSCLAVAGMPEAGSAERRRYSACNTKLRGCVFLRQHAASAQRDCEFHREVNQDPLRLAVEQHMLSGF